MRTCLFALALTSGALGCVAAPIDEEEATGNSEQELLPFCTTSTGPYTSSSPYPSSSSGHLEETIDLGIAGDRDDVAWVERRLSAPSSLWSRTTVSTTVTVTRASVETNATPLTAYASAGVNLLLEVRDGTRVLCSQRVELLSRNTGAGGGSDGSLAPTTRSLSCSFNATGLTSAPTARTSLETWATVGGFFATAYVRAAADAGAISETKCMSLTF